MNKNELLNIIQSPTTSIDEKTTHQLEELIQEYPYFQGGHILLARALFISNNVFADKKIKKAAVYTTDRKKLKAFVNAPVLEFKESIQKTVPKIENTSENITEPAPVVTKTIESAKPTTKQHKEELTEIEKTLVELKSTRENSAESLKSTPKPKKKTTVSKKSPPSEAAQPKKNKTVKAKKKAPAKRSSQKKEIQSSKKKEKKDLSTSRLGDVILDTTNNQTESLKEDDSVDLLLKYLEHTRSKKRAPKKNTKDQVNIIDSFIQSEPSITRGGHTKSSNVDLSQGSTVENFNIITENMALLYARQGNISRSISIYEELILKYPQKKSYFASQIEKLKN